MSQDFRTGFFDRAVNAFSDFLRVGNGSFAVQNSHTVSPLMLQAESDALLVAFKTGTAGDVDRVLRGTEIRHIMFHLFLHFLGQELERDTELFS